MVTAIGRLTVDHIEASDHEIRLRLVPTPVQLPSRSPRSAGQGRREVRTGCPCAAEKETGSGVESGTVPTHAVIGTAVLWPIRQATAVALMEM